MAKTHILSTTSVGNVGGGEDDLISLPLEPLGLLPVSWTNAGYFAFDFFGTSTTSVGNGVRWKVYFMSGVLIDFYTAEPDTTNWRIEGKVFIEGENAQRAIATITTNRGESKSVYTTQTQAPSSSIVFKCTGEADSGTTNHVIQAVGWASWVGR